MSELPPRGHVSARKRFLAERGNLRWILSMVAVAAVVVGIVLVLIYRERSRTAGDPPAATTGRSERAADPPAAPTAPERATREAAPTAPDR
jgi:sugar phosphate permease